MNKLSGLEIKDKNNIVWISASERVQIRDKKVVSRDYSRQKCDNERGRCYEDEDTRSRTPQLCMDFVSLSHVPGTHIFILLTRSVCYGSISALLPF